MKSPPPPLARRYADGPIMHSLPFTFSVLRPKELEVPVECMVTASTCSVPGFVLSPLHSFTQQLPCMVGAFVIPILKMRKLKLRAGRHRDSGPRVCSVILCSLLPPRLSPLSHRQMRPSFLLSQVILRGADSQEGPAGMGPCSTTALPRPGPSSLSVCSQTLQAQ